jgi:hypothetical protein
LRFQLLDTLLLRRGGFGDIRDAHARSWWACKSQSQQKHGLQAFDGCALISARTTMVAVTPLDNLLTW